MLLRCGEFSVRAVRYHSESGNEGDILLSILDAHILDKQIIRLISLLLQNGLFKKQEYSRHTMGVHQGDSLSPLLSNIYLDQMDKFLDSRSIVFVRYADDFVVLGKTSEEILRAKRELDEVNFLCLLRAFCSKSFIFWHKSVKKLAFLAINF